MNQPEPLAKLAASMGMPSLGLTDHGTLAGIPAFVKACQKHGVKPIIGLEAYLVPDHKQHVDFKKHNGKIMRAGYHLTLLARNLEGYRNLVRLNNVSHLEGFYFRPKIDLATLAKHAGGLIVLSGCVGSEIADLATMGDIDRAQQLIGWFSEVFGRDNTFIEVMENGMKDDMQRRATVGQHELARRSGFPLVPTNDAHYLTEDHQRFHNLMFSAESAQEASRAAKDGKQARKGLSGYDGIYHLKTPEEMTKVFGDLAQNTLRVAERVESFDIFSKEMRLPSKLKDSQGMLTTLAQAGLSHRGLSGKPVYEARLRHELEVIRQLGFANYFLTTRDIIGILRDSDCATGWGRGSSGASLVCYCLEITHADPIRYGLLFERMLSADRPDWPDVDIDIPRNRRDDVLEKISNKFGADKVAHISTFQTFRPKMLIRDLCRIHELSQQVSDRWAGHVPFDVKTWEDLEKSDAFDTLKADLEKTKEGRIILEAMVELLGVQRHVGVHASGLVIADVPIAEHLPVRVEKTKDDHQRMVTQYTMDHLAPFGFLKFDILGLNTLDVIHSAAREVGADLHTIDVEDPKPYEMIAAGQVDGVFQLDNTAMCADLCKRVKPTNMVDLATILAVNRPGVMDSDQYGIYLGRRNNTMEVSYWHPDLKPYMEDHYGVPIFQEDLMQVAMTLAGYAPVEAYGIMKGVAKKDMEIIDKHLVTFADRARAMGRVSEETLRQIMEQFKAAGRYSFNRSHAVVYAHVSYACAWLSCYHPVVFFKWLITAATNEEDRTKYLSAAMNRGIKIAYPHVNRSESGLTTDGNMLRMGLLSIRGVGPITVKEIMAARPFKTSEDVLKIANRTVYAHLWAAHALDGVEGLDRHPPAILKTAAEVLGVAPEGLREEYGDVMALTKAVPTGQIGAEPASAVVQVSDFRPQKTKKGDPMGFLDLIDAFGPKVEAVIFKEALKMCKPEKGQTYHAVLKRSARGGFMIERLTPVEVVRRHYAAGGT
jgi:DNA polymerase-3 subunit alpha